MRLYIRIGTTGIPFPNNLPQLISYAQNEFIRCIHIYISYPSLELIMNYNILLYTCDGPIIFD